MRGGDTGPGVREPWGCSAVWENWEKQLCPASTPPAARQQAAEPLSAEAGTAAFEMAAVTFSGLLTKARMKSTVACFSSYTGNQLASNKGGEQGGL